MFSTITTVYTWLSILSAVVAACCALWTSNSARKQRGYRRKLSELELDMADLLALMQLLQESHKKLRTREAVAAHRSSKSSSPGSSGKGSTSKSLEGDFPDPATTSPIQMLNFNMRKNGLG